MQQQFRDQLKQTVPLSPFPPSSLRPCLSLSLWLCPFPPSKVKAGGFWGCSESLPLWDNSLEQEAPAVPVPAP